MEMAHVKNSSPIRHLQFSPNGTYIAAINDHSISPTFHLWQIEKGACIELSIDVKNMPIIFSSIRNITFSNDSKEIAISGTHDIDNSNVHKSWNKYFLATFATQNGKMKLMKLFKDNFTNPLSCLAYDKSGKNIAFGTTYGYRNYRLEIIDSMSGEVRHQLAWQERIDLVVFNPDGTKVAIKSFDHISIVNLLKNRVINKFCDEGEDIKRMQFYDDYGRIILLSSQKCILLDFVRRAVGTFACQENCELTDFKLSKNKKYLILGERKLPTKELSPSKKYRHNHYISIINVANGYTINQYSRQPVDALSCDSNLEQITSATATHGIPEIKTIRLS
jgi:WD40 repeat protein